MESRKQKWNLHCCLLDSHCRRYAGWVWRVYLNSPWWHVGVALRPGDKFVRLDGGSWFCCRRWPPSK